MDTVETKFFTYGSLEKPMRLESGNTIGPVTIAYETWGVLSPERDNAVLVFHALSGSQHASGYCPTVKGCERYWSDECRIGWWNGWIGPGLAFDTNRYFVICANYLGGCYGSTGPTSINPETGKAYGPRFPIVSASDVVDSQIRLLDHLGIDRLVAATGASLGGMLALDLAIRYPDRLVSCIPIATGAKVTALTKVLNFEQIYAIEEDPHFNFGDYYGGTEPEKGLILARMIAHKTFVSLMYIEQRARGEMYQSADDLKGYRIQHQVESYMLHQGKKFVSRFDANTYLRIMNIWQQFDLFQRSPDGALETLFLPCTHMQFLVFTIDSDVCFYPEEQTELVSALKVVGIPVQHVTIHSEKGHDSFLLEPEIFQPHIDYLLVGIQERIRREAAANGGVAKPKSVDAPVWHI